SRNVPFPLEPEHVGLDSPEIARTNAGSVQPASDVQKIEVGGRRLNAETVHHETSSEQREIERLAVEGDEQRSVAHPFCDTLQHRRFFPELTQQELLDHQVPNSRWRFRLEPR